MDEKGGTMARAGNESVSQGRDAGGLWLLYAHFVALLRNSDFILNANGKLLRENV